MARGAKLSVLGLYNYDNSIFDTLNLPDGMNKDALRDRILIETAELSCLYPNPNIFKIALKAWSDTNIQRWERVWNTIQYTYNPFENFDMTEEYEHTRIPNLTQTSQNSGSDTSDSFVKGFDNGSLVQNAQAKATLGTNNTIKNTGSEIESYKKHSYGDASVRAVPDVIKSEREEKLYDFYKYIINDFKRNFCNLCY